MSKAPLTDGLTEATGKHSVADVQTQAEINDVLQTDAASKRAFISWGERATRIFTYGFVDWIFNAAVGVGFNYWAEKSEKGQKYFSGAVKNVLEKGLRPILVGRNSQLDSSDPSRLKAESNLNTSVKYGNMFIGIITGGMFTIPPLLILETRKVRKAMTKFLDRLFYGKEKVENDPKFQQAYKEIDEEPKKDFWTGMYTRFMALSPLLALVLIPKTHKIIQEKYFDKIADVSGKLADVAHIKPTDKMQEIHDTSVSQDKQITNWRYMHQSIGMDFGLGPFYAILHGFLYQKFARLTHRDKSAKAEEAKTHHQAAIATNASADQIVAKEEEPELEKPSRWKTLTKRLSHTERASQADAPLVEAAR